MEDPTPDWRILEVQKLHKKARDSLPNKSDVEFPQFSQLPFELREVIWTMACLAPRVHIIEAIELERVKTHSGHFTRSRADSISKTCKEARELVLSLKLDYFRSRGSGHKVEMGLIHSVVMYSQRNYFAINFDTFWFMGKMNQRLDDSTMSCGTTWYCGKCNQKHHWLNGLGAWCRCLTSRRIPILPSIAIRLQQWAAPNFSKYGDIAFHGQMPSTFSALWGHMALAFNRSVKEMLLVVDEFGSFDSERDPVFLSPDENPRSGILMKTGDDFLKTDYRRRSHAMFWFAAQEATWVDSAKCIRLQLEELRQRRMADRGRYLLMNGKEHPALPDLSNWVIPTIRFVEARRGSDHRLLIP